MSVSVRNVAFCVLVIKSSMTWKAKEIKFAELVKDFCFCHSGYVTFPLQPCLSRLKLTLDVEVEFLDLQTWYKTFCCTSSLFLLCSILFFHSHAAGCEWDFGLGIVVRSAWWALQILCIRFTLTAQGHLYMLMSWKKKKEEALLKYFDQTYTFSPGCLLWKSVKRLQAASYRWMTEV